MAHNGFMMVVALSNLYEVRIALFLMLPVECLIIRSFEVFQTSSFFTTTSSKPMRLSGK